MSSSKATVVNPVEEEVMRSLTPEEKILIEETFKAEMNKVFQDTEERVADVKKIFEKKKQKIEKDMIESLEMIEEQKSKKITQISMKRAELIMNVLKRNAIEKKKKERKEQLEKNLIAFKEDNERLRRLNSGEGI